MELWSYGVMELLVVRFTHAAIPSPTERIHNAHAKCAKCLYRGLVQCILAARINPCSSTIVPESFDEVPSSNRGSRHADEQLIRIGTVPQHYASVQTNHE